MNLVEFPQQTIVIAKDQPPYLPLPAWRNPQDPEGRVICKWKLTWRERLTVLFRGTIWHHVLTHNQPLQPQLLQVDFPFQPPKRKTLLEWLKDLQWKTASQKPIK
jgi:hypothetical protein